MAPVSVKYIVSFSSQDPKNPVENLQKGDGSKRWLSAPGDKTGQLQAIFQLERSTVLSHIDIGTYGVFSIQIKVGRSSWPQNQEYVTLLPATTCMTPNDSRFGKNKVAMKLLKQANFDADAKKESWDRFKVVCSQPFRKDAQFGLSVLRVVGADETSDTGPSTPRQRQPSRSTESPSSRTPQGVKRKLPEDDSPQQKSVSEIANHFFGKKSSRDGVAEQLKSRLTKIGASAENGNAKEATFSRNVQLVMAAAEKLPRYKVSGTPGRIIIASPMASINKKKRQSFDEEVDEFLGKLDVTSLDLANVTFADLRHRLEKQKFRKLSKDEKKTFFGKVNSFIEKVTDNNAKSPPNHSQVSSPEWETPRNQKASVSGSKPNKRPDIRDTNPRRPCPNFGIAEIAASSTPSRDMPVGPFSPPVLAPSPTSNCVPRKKELPLDKPLQTKTGKIIFKKSTPRGRKNNTPATGKKKKKIVKPATDLSQQMFSLFDDDSDSGIPPPDFGNPRKRKRTTGAEIPATDGVWLCKGAGSSENVVPKEVVKTGGRGKAGAGRTGNGRGKKAAHSSFDEFGSAREDLYWECPHCAGTMLKNKMKCHKALCDGTALEILSSDSDVEVMDSEQTALGATPQRSTGTPQRSTGTPQRSTATPQRSTATPQRSTATPQRSTAMPSHTGMTPGLNACSLATPSRSVATPGRSNTPKLNPTHRDSVTNKTDSGSSKDSSHQTDGPSAYVSGNFSSISYVSDSAGLNQVAALDEGDQDGQCPLCFQTYPLVVLAQHADMCASLIGL